MLPVTNNGEAWNILLTASGLIVHVFAALFDDHLCYVRGTMRGIVNA